MPGNTAAIAADTSSPAAANTPVVAAAAATLALPSVAPRPVKSAAADAIRSGAAITSDTCHLPRVITTMAALTIARSPSANRQDYIVARQGAMSQGFRAIVSSFLRCRHTDRGRIITASPAAAVVAGAGAIDARPKRLCLRGLDHEIYFVMFDRCIKYRVVCFA